MNARDYFVAAREAAETVATYDARLAREREKCGLRARSLEPSCHGSFLDAMRHADRVVDMEEARPRELRDAEQIVRDAVAVLAGVSSVHPRWCQVVGLRFLARWRWDAVANRVGMTRAEAEAACDACLDWVDSEGIARVREMQIAREGVTSAT